MRIFILIFSVVLYSSVTEAATANCRRMGLKQKDCMLVLSPYKVHIWKNRIFINNKVFRTHYEFPLQGTAVEWSQVRLVKKGDKYFFETYIWDNPDKKTNIQNLVWNIFKIDGIDIYKSHDLVLQKRVPKNDNQGFIFEKKIKNSFFVKADKCHWKLGHKSGPFEFNKMLPLALKESMVEKENK